MKREIPEDQNGPSPIKNKISISSSKGLSIDQIVDRQTAEGSWTELELIGLIFGKKVEESIAKEKNLVVIITFMIATWIEKKFSESQYILVIKKGFNFAKRNSESLDELDLLYGKYIT